MLKLLRAAYLLLVAASAIVVAVSMRNGVDADLFSLMGDNDSQLQLLAKSTSSIIQVIPESIEAQNYCKSLGVFEDEADPKEMYSLVLEKGKGLLSEKSRSWLSTGETNRIVRSAIRRDYSGFTLFPKEDDPYYLLHDFVMSLAALRPSETIMVGQVGFGNPAIPELLKLANSNEIAVSGAPFHTYLSTESSKREINFLGIVSLVGVFVLGWLLFRSLGFILPVVLTLGGGFLVATAAVCLLPGRPHVLTMLFGTTLIGLGVDYCYHALAGRYDGADGRQLSRNLLFALLTTCLAFLPLFFSSIVVLRQMATFLIAGLVAVFASVMLWYVKSR